MRYLVLTILFLLSLILQSTLFTHLTIAGIKPDLVLILIIFYAILHGPKEGALAGIIGGLLQDLLFGQNLCMNALTKLTVGYLFGLLERKIYRENLLIPMLMVFTGTLINEVFLYLFRVTVGISTGNLISIRGIILISAIYNCGLAPFMYPKFYISSQKGLLRITDR